MLERGFFLTRLAIRRQLAAMPQDLYLIRLIHQATRRAFPGERLWTAAQLTSTATIRFLRLRNREGCDVYIHPYAAGQNAGYILLDLDAAQAAVVDTMRRQGHEPCVVVRTSPGHLQAWLHLSRSPLPPALATAVARQLAGTYGADLASADWRHLGRLAGFTNQKPERRTCIGYAPWVTILHAQAGLVSRTADLLQSPAALWTPPTAGRSGEDGASRIAPISACEAIGIYQHCLERWRIRERFPRPDWSIVDLWVARELLSHNMAPARVRAVLQLGSPQFPRRHGDPQDYLHRTLRRAAFSRCAPPPPVCASGSGMLPGDSHC